MAQFPHSVHPSSTINPFSSNSRTCEGHTTTQQPQYPQFSDKISIYITLRKNNITKYGIRFLYILCYNLKSLLRLIEPV